MDYNLQSTNYNLLPNKGFTLIELLVVIAITVALATISAVNFAGYRNKQDLDLTGREIISVLRNAQNRSISQESGSRFGVHFNNTDQNNGYYTLFNGTSSASGILIAKKSLRNSVKFISPSSGASVDVVFNPVSGLPGASSTIIIALKVNVLSSSTININVNGQIQY